MPDANSIAREYERREQEKGWRSDVPSSLSYTAAPVSKRGTVKIHLSVCGGYEALLKDVVMVRDGDILTIIDSEENVTLYRLQPGNYVTFERTRAGE